MKQRNNQKNNARHRENKNRASQNLQSKSFLIFQKNIYKGHNKEEI